MSDTLPYLYNFANSLADHFLTTFEDENRRRKVLSLLLDLMARICENQFDMTRPECEAAVLGRDVLQKLAARPVSRDDAILLGELLHGYLGKRAVPPAGWDRAYAIAAALGASERPVVRNNPPGWEGR